MGNDSSQARSDTALRKMLADWAEIPTTVELPGFVFPMIICPGIDDPGIQFSMGGDSAIEARKRGAFGARRDATEGTRSGDQVVDAR